MLEKGVLMEMLKLYLVVRDRGGYEVVTENGLWGLVAEESGFRSTIAPSLKLIYPDYLDRLQKWLQRTIDDRDSKVGLKLESECKGGLSCENLDEKKNNGDPAHFDLNKSRLHSGIGSKFYWGGEVRKCVVLKGEENGNDKSVELSLACEDGFNQVKCIVASEHSVVSYNGDKEEDTCTIRAEDGKCDITSGKVVGENRFNSKRKREDNMALLDWIGNVAKDQYDPIQSLSDASNGSSCGNEQLWKQVLLAREAMRLKRDSGSSGNKLVWQKKQKMHPTMYEEYSGFTFPRYSQRILSATEPKALVSPNESRANSYSSPPTTRRDLDSNVKTVDPLASLWINSHRRKRIHVGRKYQAQVPEWTGKTCKSDSKWLGTHSWSQKKGEISNHLTERDDIGFGRHEFCACKFPDTSECVRFHVAEKRNKVKLELGSVFYHWQFDKMGEEVAVSWSKKDEKRFEAILGLNLHGPFWNEIHKHFPCKTREQLVSYYFNVFLLQQRGWQNRCNPDEINSDADEPGFGLGTVSL